MAFGLPYSIYAFTYARSLLLIPRRGYDVMTGVKALLSNDMRPDSEKEKHSGATRLDL
jgi:hypothetical protein